MCLNVSYSIHYNILSEKNNHSAELVAINLVDYKKHETYIYIDLSKAFGIPIFNRIADITLILINKIVYLYLYI